MFSNISIHILSVNIKQTHLEALDVAEAIAIVTGMVKTNLTCDKNDLSKYKLTPNHYKITHKFHQEITTFKAFLYFYNAICYFKTSVTRSIQIHFQLLI